MNPTETNLRDDALPGIAEAHDDAHHAAHSHGSPGDQMFGFVIFLLSESVIFFSFFAGYIVYKTTAQTWLPKGVLGLEVR